MTTIKLKDCANIKTGKLNSNAAVIGGIYPFFTCDPETSQIDYFSFDEEAILLAGNNASGKFNIKYYVGKFNAYQRTYIINSSTDILATKYLYYFLSTKLPQFTTLSSGSATKFLTKALLDNCDIEVPSLAEQSHIVDILGTLDEKIENLEEINSKLQSEYGWNVDHILPQSKGGATADYNLICCHIKTNDEKADKFPCFTANETVFEIVKVQNHYEIKAKGEIRSDEPLNYFDSASGIRSFKTLKNIQGKERFVGTVFIKLSGLTNTALIDFIDVMLDKEYISVEGDCVNWTDIVIIARNNYMPLKSEIAELLDKCVLLNTYLSSYFEPCGYIKAFDIYFEVDAFDNNFSMYQNIKDVKCPNTEYRSYPYKYQFKAGYKPYHDSLFVNGLVLENTEAGQKVTRESNSEYTEYNFVFTKLSENLKKEASGK